MMSDDERQEQGGGKRRRVADGSKQDDVEAQLLNHWSQWLKAAGAERDVSLNGVWHYLKQLEFALTDRCSMFELINKIPNHIPLRGTAPKTSADGAAPQSGEKSDVPPGVAPAESGGPPSNKAQDGAAKKLQELDTKLDNLDRYIRSWIKHTLQEVSGKVDVLSDSVPLVGAQHRRFEERLTSLETKLDTTLGRFEAVLERAEQRFGWDDTQKVMELQRKADALARDTIRHEVSEALGPALSLIAKAVEPLGESVGGKFSALFELLRDEALRAGIRIESIS